jgi:hypothetical protein
MEPHVHTTPAESHAFGLEPQTLVNRGISTQFDLSTCAHDSVPGQAHG